MFSRKMGWKKRLWGLTNEKNKNIHPSTQLPTNPPIPPTHPAIFSFIPPPTRPATSLLLRPFTPRLSIHWCPLHLSYPSSIHPSFLLFTHPSNLPFTCPSPHPPTFHNHRPRLHWKRRKETEKEKKKKYHWSLSSRLSVNTSSATVSLPSSEKMSRAVCPPCPTQD